MGSSTIRFARITSLIGATGMNWRSFAMKKKLILMGIALVALTGCLSTAEEAFEEDFEEEFESITSIIPFRLETELANNIELEDEVWFEFILEPVESEVETVVPMFENTVVSTATMRNSTFDFGEVEFRESGVFEYRVFQGVSEETGEGSEIGAWLIDDSVFYVRFTVSEYEDELVVDVQMTREFDGESEEALEIVFVNRYEVAFLGVWEYGFGRNSLLARSVEFLDNGVVLNASANDQEWERLWEINENGQLVVIDDVNDSQAVVMIELFENRLRLTDEEGRIGTWYQEGTREYRDDLTFLGVWEYGHGRRLFEDSEDFVFLNRMQGLEFHENGILQLLDNQGPLTRWSLLWELNETGQLVIGGGFEDFIIEVNEQSLTIIDETGEIGVWYRAGSEHEQDWIIMDYLDYFEIEAGYRIVRNAEILGDQFDFVVYDLESINIGDEERWRSWHFVVVVKRNGEVFGVTRNESYSLATTVYDVVREVDLNFDGQNDILLSRGIRMYMSCTRFNLYHAFLQLDDQLVYMPSFSNICSPSFDFDRENQRILAARMVDGTCHHDGRMMYELIGHEWVLTGDLIIRNMVEDRRYITERLMVNGQWQEWELCYKRRTSDGFELCEDTEEQALLYERIYGEDSFWGY